MEDDARVTAENERKTCEEESQAARKEIKKKEETIRVNQKVQHLSLSFLSFYFAGSS